MFYWPSENHQSLLAYNRIIMGGWPDIRRKFFFNEWFCFHKQIVRIVCLDRVIRSKTCNFLIGQSTAEKHYDVNHKKICLCWSILMYIYDLMKNGHNCIYYIIRRVFIFHHKRSTACFFFWVFHWKYIFYVKSLKDYWRYSNRKQLFEVKLFQLRFYKNDEFKCDCNC